MSDTKTELNDIILNKNSGDFSGFKKVLLAVATFAVLLIVVVVIMSTLSDDNAGLATTLKKESQSKIIPPEPDTITQSSSDLFKPAVISADEPAKIEASELDLEATVQEVEEINESVADVVQAPAPAEEVTIVEDPYEKVEVAPIVIKPVTTVKKVTPKKVVKKTKGSKKPVVNKHYVQVGSFVKAKPNKKMIKKITGLGLNYALKRVSVRGTMVTKLLIGPYDSYREARKAQTMIKQKIESSAFIYKAK